ncbi:MAG: hypothetical protein GY775_05395 [Candidatus Scalindua sp.]|nr:hypothetical protein [Candidatus Scalindua sp.]
MQINTIIQVFTNHIQIELRKLFVRLSETWDFRQFEDDLMTLVNQLEAFLTMYALENLFSDPVFLARLKLLGGKLGMRFQRHQILHVRLGNGLQIPVLSPYFLKTIPKRGRKKRGRNGRGKHLGLGILGIVGQASPAFLSKTVQMALLCPSFEVAKNVLAEQGININIKVLRRYCKLIGARGMKWRGIISLDGTENLKGSTIVIGIDGGRLRERRGKRGRWKKGQKRRGFYTDWREPKLFTIYFVDAHGEVMREIAPLHDATMGDHKAAFALLEQYLSVLPLEQAEKIVFCGDGASWIWSDVVSLCERMKLETSKVHQVLDYTHAKQQLGKLLDYVGTKGGAKRKKRKLDSKWKKLLWNGQIERLRIEIEKHCVGKRKDAALRKWTTYFKKNRARMQYQAFEKQNIPRGSGSVESAIRRIINLRLKAPGTFWKNEMAEAILFLRSQLISGRWSMMMRNVGRQLARMLHRINDNKLNVKQFQPRLNKTEMDNLVR